MKQKLFPIILSIMLAIVVVAYIFISSQPDIGKTHAVTTNEAKKIAYIIFLCFGFFTLFLGVLYFIRTKKFRDHGVVTRGVVIGITSRFVCRHGVIDVANIQYQDQHGNNHQFQQLLYQERGKVKVGDTASIMYVSHQPHKAGMAHLHPDRINVISLGFVSIVVMMFFGGMILVAPSP